MTGAETVQSFSCPNYSGLLYNKANTKTKEIKYITNDEIQEEKILNIFKENQVTPINSEEIIADLFRTIY